MPIHCHYNQIVATIVTFNPQFEIFEKNILAIYSQVSNIIIVDNGSANIRLFQQQLKTYTKLYWILNTENIGIAAALNQAVLYAESIKAEWLLTLDQDSVVPDNLIRTYQQYIEDDSIGLLCCPIFDRNVGLLSKSPIVEETEEVEECITSASMLRISAWHKVGGFFEDLFIDGVDIDFCYLIRKHGFRILRINSIQLLHELGHSQAITILGKKLFLFHHPPIRCYYMTRNTLYLGIRHKGFWHFALITIKRSFLMVGFESDKLKKLLAIFYGIRDALLFRKLGKAPNLKIFKSKSR